MHEQHLEVLRERTEPVEGLLGSGTTGRGEVLEQGLGLPADEPVRALAHRSGERDGGGLVEQPGPHQPGDPGEGVDVGIGEGDVGVGDVREPQRAPQLAGGHLRDARLGGDLATAPSARPPRSRRSSSAGSVTGAGGRAGSAPLRAASRRTAPRRAVRRRPRRASRAPGSCAPAPAAHAAGAPSHAPARRRRRRGRRRRRSRRRSRRSIPSPSAASGAGPGPICR